MEIEHLTAQTSEASEGNVLAGNGNADVTEQKEGAEPAQAEFSDSDTEEDSKAKQSAAQNSENARRRREAEQRRAQETLERERRAAREAAIIETLGGKNPYTGEDMKDALDIEEYQIMKEIDDQGGDPVGDFAKFHKAKEREKESKATREAERANWIRQDRDAFLAKYPNVDLKELVENEEFRDFYSFANEGRQEARPLAEVYERYQSMMGGQRQQARQMAAQMLANQKASVGALSTADSGESDFFTAEQVRKMNNAEVHKNYDKIMKSMKKW